MVHRVELTRSAINGHWQTIIDHPAPVESSNSGHSLVLREAQALQSYTNRLLLAMSAAMACPSGRVGEQLERHADKHRFPMRIRPGDRPPVQRSANRPLMWSSGNWAALRPFEGGLIAHRNRASSAFRVRSAGCDSAKVVDLMLV